MAASGLLDPDGYVGRLDQNRRSLPRLQAEAHLHRRHDVPSVTSVMVPVSWFLVESRMCAA